MENQNFNPNEIKPEMVTYDPLKHISIGEKSLVDKEQIEKMLKMLDGKLADIAKNTKLENIGLNEEVKKVSDECIVKSENAIADFNEPKLNETETQEDLAVSAYRTFLHKLCQKLHSKRVQYGEACGHWGAKTYAFEAYKKAHRCYVLNRGIEAKVNESLEESLEDIVGVCLNYFSDMHYGSFERSAERFVEVLAQKNHDYGNIIEIADLDVRIDLLYTKVKRMMNLHKHIQTLNQSSENQSTNKMESLANAINDAWIDLASYAFFAWQIAKK